MMNDHDLNSALLIKLDALTEALMRYTESNMALFAALTAPDDEEAEVTPQSVPKTFDD